MPATTSASTAGSASENTDHHHQNNPKPFHAPPPASTNQERCVDAAELILYRARLEDEAMRDLTPMERFQRLDERFPENLYSRIAYRDRKEQRTGGEAARGRL